MNHYEKLAVVIFRVLGCSVLFLGLFGVASTVIGMLKSGETYAAFYAVYFYTYGAYGLAGLALFALSKPLAVLIAREL
jgi:hypothetical protein